MPNFSRIPVMVADTPAAQSKLDKTARNRAIELAGIPVRYREAQVNHSLFERMMATDGLWLYGDGGVGKTYVACGLALEYLNTNSSSVYFAPAADVVSGAISAQGLGGYALLILDDIGKGMPTDLALERLFQVVDARYRNRKKLIVTSQLKPSALVERLKSRGDSETAIAIVSRLCEQCQALQITGRNKRLV